ncbi:hypothetical protein Tco_0171891, partial [Tanacetum coccineum]
MHNPDCAGREGISPLIKCTSAIRQLAYGVNASFLDEYGVNASFLDEYMQISERSSRMALDHFCQAVMEIYGHEFLRKLTFAYWAPNIESMEVNSESNPLERNDAEGLLDESLENEEHLDVDSCDSDSPKNVNNDSVSPSSRVLREEDVRGVESDLVDSFEEGEILWVWLEFASANAKTLFLDNVGVNS